MTKFSDAVASAQKLATATENMQVRLSQNEHVHVTDSANSLVPRCDICGAQQVYMTLPDVLSAVNSVLSFIDQHEDHDEDGGLDEDGKQFRAVITSEPPANLWGNNPPRSMFSREDD